MEFMKKYIKKYWKPFIAALSLLTVETISDLMQPTIMSKIVDIGVAGRNISYVLEMSGIMLMITAIGAAGAVGRNILSSNVSQKFGAELRLDLFKKTQTFSFDNINNIETASLVTRLTNDVTQIQNFVHRMMRIFVKAPLLAVGSLIMATLLNPPLSLVLVVLVPIIGVLIFMNMKIGYPFFKKVQRALDKVNEVLREYLSGVRVVKAFNRFDYEDERFEDANQDLTSISVRAMRVMAVFTPIITLIVNIGIVAVLWIGGLSVNKGNMDVGKIIAFINYMTQILHSLMMISMGFTMFVRARASADRIDEVFKQKNNMITMGENEKVFSGKGRIEFQDVSFSYTGNLKDSVLKDISFSCLSGETVGIIGSTGAGKTSLISLIPRFYDVSRGSVKVDGVDVRDVNPRELREKISIVPQKTVLFTGTILDNLRWGKEEATQDEVVQVSTIVHAHDFISSFPEGYDTLLGQGGVNLSGGQKQRISIARALIRNPEILILDDSTSAVDVNTEGKIREAFKKFSGEMTTLIIAQRITSVLGADKILVLDNGNLVGIGSHEELMRNCEVYKDIFHSQIGKEGI